MLHDHVNAVAATKLYTNWNVNLFAIPEVERDHAVGKLSI